MLEAQRNTSDDREREQIIKDIQKISASTFLLFRLPIQSRFWYQKQCKGICAHTGRELFISSRTYIQKCWNNKSAPEP